MHRHIWIESLESTCKCGQRLDEQVGLTNCPVYGGKIMLDEEERCSLCEHPTAHGQIENTE